MYNVTILYKKYSVNTKEIKKKLQNYIKTNKGIETVLGKLAFTNSDGLGEGGNGLVYLSKINKKKIAIKFLITDSERKCTRFKSEYFNTNYVRDELCNIVNMICYGELQIEDETIIPYIIMSAYAKNLKKYRKEKDEVQEEDFKKLIEFLLTTLKSIHKKNIIHRDIKPENILVDEDEKFVLADFGIAHYKRDDFLIDNKTEKKERLANVSFSAPEQIINDYEVTQTADIYSMAQIMYWFIFENVSRGTGGEKIAKKYNWKDANVYDMIIDKCLRNNPTERFQSIEEISQFYENEKKKKKIKIINPFGDMSKFHKAVVSVVPEFFDSVNNITDKGVMCDLFNSIFSHKYNQQLWFNTGISNNPISSIIKLGNDDFLMNDKQLNIRKIWGFLTDNLYDDILLLEIDKSLPYKIEGEEYYRVAVIKNKDGDEIIVPYEKILSGYIRYNDKVHKISDLTIQERYIDNYKVIAIAPDHNCTIVPENDEFLLELQDIEKLQQEDIRELKRKIYKNKSEEVLRRL